MSEQEASTTAAHSQGKRTRFCKTSIYTSWLPGSGDRSGRLRGACEFQRSRNKGLDGIGRYGRITFDIESGSREGNLRSPRSLQAGDARLARGGAVPVRTIADRVLRSRVTRRVELHDL